MNRRAARLTTAMLFAMASAAAPLSSVAKATTCADTPFIFNEQPHTVARALGAGFAVLSDQHGQHVEMHDGKTGKLRWASASVAQGATFLANLHQQAVTVTLLPCASLYVRRWSNDSGKLLWARTLPGLPHITAANTPFLVADHDLGQGDWNRDGVPDLALLQVAREIQAPFDEGLCQPSGYCASATERTVDTRLAVIDGKTGRVLMSTTLGGPSTAESAATWTADGHALLAAYDAGSGAGTVVERLTAQSRTSATLPLPTATDLQLFGTTTPVLVSAAAATEDEAIVYTGLTPSLGVAWVHELSGGRETLRLGPATLEASGGANAMAVALNTTTGVPAWATPTPSMFGNTYDAGRWSSPTADDIAIVEPNATGDGTLVSEVLSGATGLPVAMLDADEWPEQTCDAAGGLATVVHPYTTSSTVRLRRAQTTVVWAVPFTTPKHDKPVTVCTNWQAGVSLVYAPGARAQIAIQLATGRTLWKAQLPVSVDP